MVFKFTLILLSLLVVCSYSSSEETKEDYSNENYVDSTETDDESDEYNGELDENYDESDEYNGEMDENYDESDEYNDESDENYDDSDEYYDDECTDDDDMCADWAEEGECIANPDYMLDACAVSCNSCTNDEIPYKGSIGCFDQRDNCAELKNEGQCESNKESMALECKMTCDLCEAGAKELLVDDGTGCFDLSRVCQEKKEECSEDDGYMVDHCKKTCGFC